jgi:hypothetical protein
MHSSRLAFSSLHTQQGCLLAVLAVVHNMSGVRVLLADLGLVGGLGRCRGGSAGAEGR